MALGSDTTSSPERTTAACCYSLPCANGKAAMQKEGTIMHLQSKGSGLTYFRCQPYDEKNSALELSASSCVHDKDHPEQRCLRWVELFT